MAPDRKNWLFQLTYPVALYLAVVVTFLSPAHVVHGHLKTSVSSDPLPTFPSNFLFGTASSAYQYEGAHTSDGKGLNNWDTFTHKSGRIIDGSNGDVATDHYHRYQNDVDLMASLGVNSYRFSISWARILPKGRYGSVNLAGVHFYNKLIDKLLQEGIQPFVTLSHFDIPQELADRYGSWLSPRLKEDFEYYADICFQFFGNRVKYWATFNEPNIVVMNGYRSGKFPPCRCSAPFGNCTAGDSEKEPFVAAYNIMLAHATAAKLYKNKYQREQDGLIGIVLHALWFEPISNSSADKLAANRAQSFVTNWFLDPLVFGDYPAEMKELLGSTLPEFSREDKKLLDEALDFIGINHYTSFYVKDCMLSKCDKGPGTSKTEGLYLRTPKKDGIPIGESTAMEWLYIHPKGMEEVISYIKERYNNTPMFITENGYAQENLSTTKDLLNDVKRVEYMHGYLDAMLRAIRKGADVRGYFAWSLLDNFEWLDGYTKRFGLHHMDYATMKRTPKASALWYRKYIAQHKIGRPLCRNNTRPPRHSISNPHPMFSQATSMW